MMAAKKGRELAAKALLRFWEGYLTSEHCALAPGVLVAIKAGPLEGCTAKVLRHVENDRWLVEPNALGRGVLLEIEGAALVVIEKRAAEEGNS